MYKVVWLCRFREGLDREEARRHWRDVHGPIGGSVPQVVGYVQSHAVEPLGASELGFDGYSCCWFADEDGYLASQRTPEWAELGVDGEHVFDMAWFAGRSAALDERTIVEGPAGPFKTVWVVRFREEIRSDPARAREAHEYWIREHGGRYGTAVPGIGRYLQNHCVAPLGAAGPDPGGELEFDGFSECWFADRTAYERATGSPEWAEMGADAQTFCDVDYIGRMGAVLEEHVVKAPPA